MKKLILILLLSFASVASFGRIIQKQWIFGPNQRIPINVLIYIPDNYVQGTKLPTFFFIPGNGEVGTDVNKLYTYSPLGEIRNGWRPNFIVIGLQARDIWPSKWLINTALDSLTASPTLYPYFNLNQYYLTGLSAGAGCIFDFVRNEPDATFRPPAAIIPMSLTIDAQCGDFYQNTDYLCGTDFRYEKWGSWGLAGTGDSHYGKMKRFFDRLIEAGYRAKWTSYNGGHCCWGTFYDPDYRENGMNIYEWALQFPSVVLPVKFTSFYYNFGKLIWTTEAEIDNDYFVIQKSLDGIHFSSVDTVKPNNTGRYEYKIR